MPRTFESGPARRARMPLMLAIVGASGSGKTLSAILLAEGIQRVQPGPIVVIDTESLRALKHSDGNPDRFIHVPFAPPFGPLDYIDAIKHALKHQPSTIIIDSMTHEHDGEGGVLDQHDTVVAEKGRSHDQIAWKKPKGDRTKLKHFILQQRCNWIFCFRAKEKIKPVKGGEPEDLGWQPLGDDSLIYEMDLCALLYPGVDGRPKWKSPRLHEQEMMKCPDWWRAMFAREPQLNPDIGEQLARWAAGSDVGVPAGKSSTATSSRRTSSSASDDLVARFDACTLPEVLEALKEETRRAWESIPKGEARTRVKRASEAAEERIDTAMSAGKEVSPA
jgi:hypothetical protein